eukprot:TRINITY_DN203_c0_g1_i1.p1 TRINITY_DN203_c0_g1~~TRINITY_DN203_c0_g1_i1.p1  ORF type:complete len:511 (+),score=102.99 TRINITY_DN203_c0_g1_i1:232-1764(+)
MDDSYDDDDGYGDFDYGSDDDFFGPGDDESLPANSGTNYHILTPSDIQTRQQEIISDVAELFAIPSPTARQLLHYKQWKKDLLVESFYEDSESLYRKAHVIDPTSAPPSKSSSSSSSSSSHSRKRRKSQSSSLREECSICFLDVRASKMRSGPCGHRFCNKCWSRFIVVGVNDGKITDLVCPQKDCDIFLDSRFVNSALKHETKVLEKYNRLLSDAFVNGSANIRWCPGSACGNAVEVEILKEKEVSCSCGTTFCFGCGNLPHAPTTCKMINDWNVKVGSDGETIQWLAQYTKECPKCGTNIHKDGGCQYMVCSKCSNTFCWMCLGTFDHTDHSCNKLKEEKDPNSDRALMNKFVHFYTRYQAHQQSIELEDKLMALAGQQMKEMADQGRSWIDVQYIKESTQVLMESRSMLKLTYIYGYYLPEHVHRHLFEFLQGDLETGIEKLSSILEAPGKKSRVEVINAAEYVKQRKKNLLVALLDNDIRGVGGNEKEVYENSVEKYDGWVYKSGK